MTTRHEEHDSEDSSPERGVRSGRAVNRNNTDDGDASDGGDDIPEDGIGNAETEEEEREELENGETERNSKSSVETGQLSFGTGHGYHDISIKKRGYVFKQRKWGEPKQPSKFRQVRRERSRRIDNPFLQKRECCRAKCFAVVDPLQAFATYKELKGMNREEYMRALI